MKEESFRAWLGGRIDSRSVGSYMSNARRVEKTLRQDLDACDLSEAGLSNIRRVLLAADVPLRPAGDCLSALRQYREFRSNWENKGSWSVGIPANARQSAPRRATSIDMPPSGAAILAEATGELGIDLVALVARCAIWAAPSVVTAVMKADPAAAWLPNCRRARLGEKRGVFTEGVLLDDNTQANSAIKLATFGHRNVPGFHACHIWPDSCYDARHHTSIANLILLPAPLSSLTDYDADVGAVQYGAPVPLLRAARMGGDAGEPGSGTGRPDRSAYSATAPI
jgi:hypothetical protein